MSMDVREATDFLGSEIAFNSTVTPNGDILVNISPSLHAVVNEEYYYRLDRNPATVAGTFDLQTRTTRIALPNGVTPPPPVQGRLLMSGPILAHTPGTHNGTTGFTTPIVIPPRFSLICFHFVSQAVVIGGGVKLSSAVEGTVGTF
jgi:hypothetical protein